MVTCFGEESGLVNDQFVAYVDEKTKGGWGLVTLEAHTVTEAAESFDKFFGLYRDDQIDGQRHLTEAAHKNGCKICVQLIHGGRGVNQQLLELLELMKLIPENEYQTSQKLSKKLKISEKTVRNRVQGTASVRWRTIIGLNI